MKVIKSALEFVWDKGNSGKNLKHKVEDQEAEEPFLDENKVIYKDLLPSEKENRFILVGKSKQDRLLFISFTYRNNKIRIISARDINRKEVSIYEKAI